MKSNEGHCQEYSLVNKIDNILLRLDRKVRGISDLYVWLLN